MKSCIFDSDIPWNVGKTTPHFGNAHRNWVWFSQKIREASMKWDRISCLISQTPTRREEKKKTKRHKRQKESLILWCQGRFTLLQCFLCQRGKSTIGSVMLFALCNAQPFHNAINFTQQTHAATSDQCTFQLTVHLHRVRALSFKLSFCCNFWKCLSSNL